MKEILKKLINISSVKMTLEQVKDYKELESLVKPKGKFPGTPRTLAEKSPSEVTEILTKEEILQKG